MNKVAITGASGFIGAKLCEYYANRNWQVIPLSRKSNYQLAGEFPVDSIKGCHLIIHCAHDRSSKFESIEDDVNFVGVKRLLQAADQLGIQQIVYLSSMSAHDKAQSRYGVIKHKIENLFKEANYEDRHLVVKPGLVLGDGGLFKDIHKFIISHQMVPLINGGTQPVQTIAVEELLKAIFELAEKKISGQFILAEDPGPHLRDLYQEISRLAQSNNRFIPVPFFAAHLAIKISKLVGIELPVDEENLLGLSQLKSFSTDPAKAYLSFHIADYKTSLKRLLSTEQG